MFRFDRFEELRTAKGISKKFIADAIGRSSQIIQDWKNPKKTVEPNDDQIRVVAKILDTSPEYLRGEVDEYGLSDADWSTMGILLKDFRLTHGLSLSISVDGDTVTAEDLAAFEEGRMHLKPDQIKVACRKIGIDPMAVFDMWADRLWGKKEKPIAEDDELAESLEILRECPETRTLLHASRGMTVDQIKIVAQMMRSLRGGENGESD